MLQRSGAVFMLVITLVAGAASFGTSFTHPDNLIDTVAAGSAFLALVSVGMTFVIISGGIDLSVGAVLAMSAVLTAYCAAEYGPVAAIIVPLAASALVGLAQGLLISRVALPAFIVTLAGMQLARGVAFKVTDEGNKTVLIPEDSGLRDLGSGAILGMPIPVVIALVAFAIGGVVLNRSRFGQAVFAIGGSEDAAPLMGLPVRRVKTSLYVWSAVLAGIAGILIAARSSTGEPTAGLWPGAPGHRGRRDRRHPAHGRLRDDERHARRCRAAGGHSEHHQPGRDPQPVLPGRRQRGVPAGCGGTPGGPGPTEAPAMTADDVHPVRVAVVGTGNWWGREHLRAFSSRADTTLCAVVGRTPARAQARGREFGIPWYTDLAEMLEREQPGLVATTLPNEAHFEPTLQLIRAGVPLFVEKPLVFDLAEADRLLDEAAQRDLFFAINFNHRYGKPVLLAHEAVRSGAIGDVVFATWRFGGEAGTSEHPYANLIETQCHGFDMLEHLCGPIASVAAEFTDMTGRGFSSMTVALRFAGGAVGGLTGSYDSSYAYPGTHHLEINGTRGRLVVTDTVQRFELSRAGDETATVWQAGYFNDEDRQFHRIFDRHLDEAIPALAAGGPPPIHAAAGRRALFLATAAIESFEQGRRVMTSHDITAPGAN